MSVQDALCRGVLNAECIVAHKMLLCFVDESQDLTPFLKDDKINKNKSMLELIETS